MNEPLINTQAISRQIRTKQEAEEYLAKIRPRIDILNQTIAQTQQTLIQQQDQLAQLIRDLGQHSSSMVLAEGNVLQEKQDSDQVPPNKDMFRDKIRDCGNTLSQITKTLDEATRQRKALREHEDRVKEFLAKLIRRETQSHPRSLEISANPQTNLPHNSLALEAKTERAEGILSETLPPPQSTALDSKAPQSLPKSRRSSGRRRAIRMRSETSFPTAYANPLKPPQYIPAPGEPKDAKPYEWLRRVLPLKPGETPAQTIGPYTIERKLGRGAQAVVLQGHDSIRQVALKVIDAEHVKPSTLQDMRREAQRLAGLRHENIVTVYGFGEVSISNGSDTKPSKVIYMALELMKDGNLEDLERRSGSPGSLNTPTILEACAAAGRGLIAIHASGILHRDIKPQNILIDSRACRIADLGIAADTDTEWQSVTGSLCYIAPELLEAAQLRQTLPYGPQGDVFSLGATAYRLITGQTPLGAILETSFPGQRDLIPWESPRAERLGKAWKLYVKAPLPDPRSFRKDLPEEIANIIMKAVSIDPGKRYTDAESVAEAFRIAWENCAGSGVRRRRWSWWA